MDIRFEPASEEAETMLTKIRDEHFVELNSAKILLLFDLKKRMSGGQLVLGSISKADDLARYLSIEDADSEEGYDYILRIDKLVWEMLEEESRTRLLRHELRHTDYDSMAADNPFKIRKHTIEDFYEEVELNGGNLRWAQDAMLKAEAKHNANGASSEEQREMFPGIE